MLQISEFFCPSTQWMIEWYTLRFITSGRLSRSTWNKSIHELISLIKLKTNNNKDQICSFLTETLTNYFANHTMNLYDEEYSDCAGSWWWGGRSGVTCGKVGGGGGFDLIYLMFYDHLSAHSLLDKLGRWGWWWGGGWLARKARRHWVHQKYYIEIRPEAPRVWAKDLINCIPIYCHNWDCGLGKVQVRQAWGYLAGCKMSKQAPPTAGS